MGEGAGGTRDEGARGRPNVPWRRFFWKSRKVTVKCMYFRRVFSFFWIISGLLILYEDWLIFINYGWTHSTCTSVCFMENTKLCTIVSFDWDQTQTNTYKNRFCSSWDMPDLVLTEKIQKEFDPTLIIYELPLYVTSPRRSVQWSTVQIRWDNNVEWRPGEWRWSDVVNVVLI